MSAASCISNPPGFAHSTPNAARAHRTQAATKATPVSALDTEKIARRLERSKSTTPRGYQWLANDICREVIGAPLTHAQEDQIRTGKKRLDRLEVDDNAYRQTTKRSYAPRDTRKRHPGWVTYQFILPKRLLEGLTLLTKLKAEQQAAERTQQPYGFRRRCARGKSSFVAEALNQLLTQNGLSEFCVEEWIPVQGHPHHVLRGEIACFSIPSRTGHGQFSDPPLLKRHADASAYL